MNTVKRSFFPGKDAAPALGAELKKALSAPAPAAGYAQSGWIAATLSARAAALEPPAMGEEGQAGLARFFEALSALGERLDFDSAQRLERACDRLAKAAEKEGGRPTRLAARALAAALTAAGEDDSPAETAQWEMYWAGVAAGFDTLCLELAKVGPLPEDLAEQCAQEALDWLSYDGGYESDDEYWRGPEAPAQSFRLTDAAIALSLTALAAESGAWVEELLDPQSKTLSAQSLAWALHAFEAGILDSGEADETESETLKRLQKALPSAERLGAAAASDPEAAKLFLAFGKRLMEWVPGSQEGGEERFREPDLGSGLLASNPLAGAFLAGGVRAQPSLASARDERGHTPLSLFNEALALTEAGARAGDKGWVEGAFALSERALCEMIEICSDPSCLVASPDPASMAASPSIRAAVEAAALKGASRSILASRGPGARL